MCGLAGSYRLGAFDVQAALDRLAHRGPDGRGIACSGDAVHGHVRLALLDLSAASAQPFRRGSSLLSFNGEIWNFRELKRELEAEGEAFSTVGDTEVLAAALDCWGLAALAKIEGQFAFAWSKGGAHMLARDRFGEVPLYVCRKGSGFAWASERKGLSLLAASPLPPGSVLDLTTGELRRWYALPEPGPAEQGHAEALLAELERGVALRLFADAPVCVLASGGLDSSLILALAKRARPDVVAFAAYLEEQSDDLEAARRLAQELKVKLIEVRVAPPTADNLAEAVRTIEIDSKAQVEIAALCLPLARAIAAQGFKACLSGEAADELFGGYGSMCIKGARAGDAEWRRIKVGALDKMARGNFIRCNKAFMAAGVECRLPFMQHGLVEAAVNAPKASSPPGKGLLKAAARAVLPAWVIARRKATFQGESGMAEAAARAAHDPRRFYSAELRRAYRLAA